MTLAPILFLCSACGTTPRPGDLLPRAGDEISICGELIHTGTRVVLWNDPGGYDAYRPHRHFEPDIEGPREKPERIARYGSFRRGLPPAIAARVAEQGWSREDLAQVVDRVVVHYDACGTSERCFEVLHDVRGLSAHFLLDLDGTIYQTLDVKERAWHAAQLNDRSIGIEIAHIGARTLDRDFSDWYRERSGGLGIRPERIEGKYPLGFDPPLGRPGLIQGSIHQQALHQPDFTEAQYRALEKLLQTLCKVLPGIPPTVPRTPEGGIHSTVIDDEGAGIGSTAGIIGHYHGSTGKIDPGPAFDWDRIERALQRRR